MKPQEDEVRIAVLDDIHRQWVHAPSFERLRHHARVHVFTDMEPDPQKAAARLQGFHLVVALRERTRFHRELLAALPDVELIAQTGGHVYHIDMEAATRHGVAVSVMPNGGAGGLGTAELTIGLLIALMRHIPRYNALLHRGGWEEPFGRTLSGKVLGLVGVGRVGAAVARLARAFDMHVIAWSPTLTPERGGQLGVEAVSLEDVFRRSDAVSVHVPLKPATRGLVSGRLLQLMKPNAIFINTARGAIVDEGALIELLRNRAIAGAGLDVFTEEPLPAEHPFRGLDNVLLMPHAGWPTDSAYRSFAEATATMLEAYLKGDSRYVINPEALASRADDPAAGYVFGRWR